MPVSLQGLGKQWEDKEEEAEWYSPYPRGRRRKMLLVWEQLKLKTLTVPFPLGHQPHAV
jgi:hypothetical protein